MEFNATFIVSIISFLLFVAIMNKIFYAPITKIVEEREERLKKDYDEAEQLSGEAESILKTREETLSKTSEEARKTISGKIEDFNNRSKAAITEAAKKSADEIKQRKDALQQTKVESETKLNSEVKDLANRIINKVLNENSSNGAGE